jgi:hypothetical protein
MPEPINWQQVYELLERREDRIVERFLGALNKLEARLNDHDARIDSLEDTAERRKASRETAVLILGLPQRVIGLVASAVALVLALATAWNLVRPM